MQKKTNGKLNKSILYDTLKKSINAKNCLLGYGAMGPTQYIVRAKR